MVTYRLDMCGACGPSHELSKALADNAGEFMGYDDDEPDIAIIQFPSAQHFEQFCAAYNK